MPYTLASLPDHVKKMPEKKQRQWMHIFNGCAADGGAESKCFKMANGVATKEVSELTIEDLELVAEAKAYQYVESYDYSERQVSQDVAGYNSLGASDTQGCANCQWFIAPARCAVVAGEISPTGLSSLWRAKAPWTVAPIPVTIVKDVETPAPSTDPVAPTTGGGFLAGIRAWMDKVSGGNKTDETPLGPHGLPVQARPFGVVKQKDGRTRFYTVWSNNFMDREGEIFTKAAHKEFVEWADETKEYPELWIWHTKGSRFGQVDWLDITDDGFVHASGLVDAGKEALAEKLAEEDSGVSHGFFGLQSANIVHWYRSYELSVLPLQNAAVPTTSYNILNTGAKEMGFTPEKRKYFVDLGIPEADIKAWETQTDGLADALKSAGLESKASDLGIEMAPPPTPEQKAEADFRVETVKSLQTLTELVTTLAGQVKEIKEKAVSPDAAVAAAMTAPATQAIHQASKAADNVVEGSAPVNNATKEFFQNTVLAPLMGGTQIQ